MNCPECQAWTRVLETRGELRKRQCGNLHKFWTKEFYFADYIGSKPWTEDEVSVISKHSTPSAAYKALCEVGGVRSQVAVREKFRALKKCTKATTSAGQQMADSTGPALGSRRSSVATNADSAAPPQAGSSGDEAE